MASPPRMASTLAARGTCSGTTCSTSLRRWLSVGSNAVIRLRRPAATSRRAASRRTRRRRTHETRRPGSVGHVAPAGSAATTCGVDGTSVTGFATRRSSREVDGTGVSPTTRRTSSTSYAASSTREQRWKARNGRGRPNRAGWAPTVTTPQPELA